MQADLLVKLVKFYPGSNASNMALSLDEYQIASANNLLNPNAGITLPPDPVQIEFDRINNDGTTTLYYAEIQAAYGLGATDAILIETEKAYEDANPHAPAADGQFHIDEFAALFEFVTARYSHPGIRHQNEQLSTPNDFY